MKRIVWRQRLSWLTAVVMIGLAVLVAARAVAEAKRPVAKPARPPALDVGKGKIEFPTQQLLAARTLPILPPQQLLANKTVPAPGFDNPKVEPGKVRWHKDFATACAAAQKSGKPVLLFQMMGKLDERFC